MQVRDCRRSAKGHEPDQLGLPPRASKGACGRGRRSRCGGHRRVSRLSRERRLVYYRRFLELLEQRPGSPLVDALRVELAKDVPKARAARRYSRRPDTPMSASPGGRLSGQLATAGPGGQLG
jgi:hypothetical protein